MTNPQSASDHPVTHPLLPRAITQTTWLIDDNLQVNFAHLYVVVNGQRVGLTPVENQLFYLLVRRRGQILSLAFLATNLWATTTRGAISSLRAHVRRLRLKIEPDPAHPRYLITKAGRGYLLPVTIVHR